MRNAQEEFYYFLTHFSVDLYYFFGYDQKEKNKHTSNNNLLTIGANLSYNVKFTDQFRI